MNKCVKKKHFNYRNKREYIKHNSFAFKRRDVVEHLQAWLISWRWWSPFFSFSIQRTSLSHSCVPQLCSIPGSGLTSISSAEHWPNQQPLWLLHHPRTAWAWLHSTKAKEKLKLLKIPQTKQFSHFLLCCFSVRADAWSGFKHSRAKSCVQTARPRKGELGQEVLQQHCCCYSWTLSQTTMIFPRVLQPPVGPAPVPHPCTRAVKQRNCSESLG